MKLTLSAIAAACVLAAIDTQAQTAVLYQQDWGTGNGSPSLAAVGWGQVLPPAGYSGTYQQSPAVDGDTSAPLPANTLYFGGNAGLGIFYTTNGAGNGGSGNSSFTSINPALYTNLNISVYSQWSWQGANLTCWFAVEVGGAWYVSTNQAITTAQHSAGPNFFASSVTYNPAAANWNTLTVSPGVTIGGAAPGNLSGNITGVGIVVRLVGSSSWNYNVFKVTSISNTLTLPPTLMAAPLSQMSSEGAGVSFAVKGSGTEPFTYNWLKNGNLLSNGGRISGATSSILTITNINSGDVGAYSAIVSNSAGWFDTSTNSTATLTVNAVPSDYLYAETFPFVGPLAVGYPLSVVGWSNAIADNVNRLYQNSGGDGAAFAFEGAASTHAFYVSTNSDKGASGLAFKKITPGSYPAVSFYVDIAPSYQPALVAAYFAVQINGGSWYVGSTPIPVDTSTATGTFTTYRQQYDPLAANWNTLTLNATSATIGSPAGANLAGDITGAGLVFVYTGAGNFNVDNFLVTTNAVPPTPPTITFSPYSQTVYEGAGVSFAVNATGSKPFTYYWQKDGLPLINGGRISGASSNILTIVNLNSGDAGQYSVIVSNSAGTDNSANYLTTVLTVNALSAGLLYSESFPFVGPGLSGYPVSIVGWGNAIPNNPDRLFQLAGGDGAVYAFQGTAATTAFFVGNGSDPGTSGLPYPTNIISSSTLGLTFSVDIALANSASNVTAALAVQMNSGGWYVSATNLPVDTSVDNPAYSTFTQLFSPAAANWKNLTLTAGSGATIGSTAAAPLTGTLTGAGLVFTHVGTGGTFNFDNFQITGTPLGNVAVSSQTSTTISLAWPANPNVQLQSTTDLAPPVVWANVPGSLGQSAATVNKTAAQMYFRLIGQ